MVEIFKLWINACLRILPAIVAIWAGSRLVKIEFPSLDINQITLALSGLALAYTLSNDHSERNLKIASERDKSWELRLSDLTNAVDKLSQRFETHCEAFGHSGVEALVREMLPEVQRAIAMGLQLRREIGLDKRMDTIERLVGSKGGDRTSCNVDF